MLTENQQKWVDALRSGEFEQTTGSLQDGDAYCCLGVACVVAEREGVKPRRRNHSGELIGGDMSCQPLEITDWLGIWSGNGEHEHDETFSSDTLVDLNDQEAMTFAEIADHIEKYAGSIFKCDKS